MNKILKILLIIIALSGISIAQDLHLNHPRIAILYSGLSEKFNDSNTTKVIDVITTWELFLMQNKIPYTVVYDEDIESGIEDDFDILILPSVNFISIAQLTELKLFLAEGNSIICSGSKLFDVIDDQNSFQNLNFLFNLNNIQSISTESISFLHPVVPNQLNYFRIDDNSLLQISAKNNVMQSDINENNFYSYGYTFSENELNNRKSSIIFGSIGTAKYLWIGFDITDIVGGQDNLLVFKNLITNSINWMDRKPTAYFDNFSDNISSPVIQSIQYNNAFEPELIDVLHNNNIRPILLVNPDQIIKEEVISKFDINEIVLDLTAINNLTADNVIEYLNGFYKNNQLNLNSVVVEKQFLEFADLSFINDSGIDKILYVTQFFGIPNFIFDDILLIPFSKNNAAQYSRNCINFLYYYPEFNCKSNQVDKLFAEINSLKSNGYNFTSLASLNEWWSVRNSISAKLGMISEKEMEVLINNKNPIKLNSLKVYVRENNRIDKKSFTVTLNNTLLEYYFDKISGLIVINLDNISPNSVSKIKLKY